MLVKLFLVLVVLQHHIYMEINHVVSMIYSWVKIRKISRIL